MFDAMRDQALGEKMVEAVVVDNNDPLKMRRLKVRASRVHPSDTVPDSHLPWALCGVDAGQGPNSNSGSFAVPRIGSIIQVYFQDGDPDHPIYDGGLTDINGVPAVFKTNYPNRVGVLVHNGTQFYVDGETNDLVVQHQGTTIHILPDGRLTISTAGDLSLQVTGDIHSTAGNWSHTGNFNLVGNLDVTGSNMKHNGKSVGDTHKHSGVFPGGGNSGNPI